MMKMFEQILKCAVAQKVTMKKHNPNSEESGPPQLNTFSWGFNHQLSKTILNLIKLDGGISHQFTHGASGLPLMPIILCWVLRSLGMIF